MIDAGYFPKMVVPGPDGFSVRGERDICSVSNCISGEPDNWIEKWLHNWLGWFNSPDDAWSVVPLEERTTYRLFGYRLHPSWFRAGEASPVHVPDDVRPVPIPTGWQSLGFDAVSKYMEFQQVLGFGCSPLSCNGLHVEMAVNSHCLFATLEDAIAGAQRFSIDQPEPGDYYVVEVLERGLEWVAAQQPLAADGQPLAE